MGLDGNWHLWLCPTHCCAVSWNLERWEGSLHTSENLWGHPGEMDACGGDSRPRNGAAPASRAVPVLGVLSQWCLLQLVSKLLQVVPLKIVVVCV